MNKRNKNKRGFSLLELIIAIFVLLVGIMGVLSLIVSTLRNTMDDRDQLIASGLAQEGIELVRNVRDYNLLQGETFPALGNGDSGFPDSDNPNCRIDYSGLEIIPQLECGGNADNNLFYLNPSDGMYWHSSGVEATRFRRNIKIEYTSELPSTYKTGVDVTSMVWWSGSPTVPSELECNLANQCISSRAHLANR